MAQSVVFPGPEGATLTLKLLTNGTDTVVDTETGITGNTNDPSRYTATTIDDALEGTYNVLVTDDNNGDAVVYSGWVDLTGTSGAPHDTYIESDVTYTYDTTNSVAQRAAEPRRMTTEEGTVVERSMDEIIKADQYDKANQVGDDPLHGLRISRCKPAGAP